MDFSPLIRRMKMTGNISLYSAPKPANTSEEPRGTLLCSIDVHPEGGRLSGTVINSGTATWFRYIDDDTTLDGDVSLEAGLGKLRVNSTHLPQDGMVEIITFFLTKNRGTGRTPWYKKLRDWWSK